MVDLARGVSISQSALESTTSSPSSYAMSATNSDTFEPEVMLHILTNTRPPDTQLKFKNDWRKAVSNTAARIAFVHTEPHGPHLLGGIFCC